MFDDMSKDTEDYLDEETFGCEDTDNGESPSNCEFLCDICK